MTATFKPPTTPGDFQDLIGDKKFMNDLTGEGADAVGNFLQSYYKASRDEKNKELEEFKSDLTTQMQADLTVAMREMRLEMAQTEPTSNEPVKMLNFSRGETYNSGAAGAQLNARDYTVSDYFRAANPEGLNKQSDREKLVELRTKNHEIMSAWTGTAGADGGLLVPEELRSEMLTLALPDEVVRPRATVITSSGGKVAFPIIENANQVSSVFGGVEAYWVDEMEAAGDTSPKFGKVEMEPKGIMARAKVPNDLLNDVPGLSSYISMMYPKAIAMAEDRAFFNGDGTVNAQGFLKSDAVISVTRTTTGQIKAEDVLNMYSRLIPGSGAVWLYNKSSFPSIAKLKLDVGTGGVPLFTFNLADGPQTSLLGMPLIDSARIPTLGAAGDLMLVDLAYYLILDRQATELSVTDHEYHSTNATGYRFFSRLDGRTWLKSAVTPENGDTVSPFVQLAA